jgi:hypothetical protein
MSKPARTTRVLIAMFFTLMAVIAVRPAAGLAAPPEPPQLSFEPGSYDFGLQPVNNGSGQANFQLRNTGSEGVLVNSIEIVGPGSEAFWTNTNCFGTYLQPNETCYVQVYFSPRDTTEYAVQLRANAGPYSFEAELTGTGGRAILEPAFNPFDFGSTPVGSPGTTREIEIANVGNMPAGVFIAVISGGAVGSYQLLDEDCTGYMIAPDATCTVQVRFRPLSEGVKKATLSLFGDSDGGTQIVLTGVGSAPEPSPGAAADPPAAAGSAASALAPVPDTGGKAPNRKHRRLKRRHKRAAVHSARLVLRGHNSG